MRDVIVIGAGGGGPVLAKELAAHGLDVLVLEAGPRHLRPEKEWRHLENDANNPVSGYFRWGPADRSKSEWLRETPQNCFVWQLSGVGGTTQHYYGNCPRAVPGVFHGLDPAGLIRALALRLGVVVGSRNHERDEPVEGVAREVRLRRQRRLEPSLPRQERRELREDRGSADPLEEPSPRETCGTRGNPVARAAVPCPAHRARPYHRAPARVALPRSPRRPRAPGGRSRTSPAEAPRRSGRRPTLPRGCPRRSAPHARGSADPRARPSRARRRRG